MTLHSTITQADIRRAAAVAKAEGVTVEIERAGTKIRITPPTFKANDATTLAQVKEIRL